MLLHARALAFTHPRSGERITAIAPLDDEFECALELFGWQAPLPAPGT